MKCNWNDSLEQDTGVQAAFMGSDGWKPCPKGKSRAQGSFQLMSFTLASVCTKCTLPPPLSRNAYLEASAEGAYDFKE